MVAISSTVYSNARCVSCGTIAILREMTDRGMMSRPVPSSSIRPAEGCSRPPSIRRSVVFPDPFGPRMPTRPPRGIRTLTSSNTREPRSYAKDTPEATRPVSLIEHQIFGDASAVGSSARRPDPQRPRECLARRDDCVVLATFTAGVDLTCDELVEQVFGKIPAEERFVQLARSHRHDTRARARGEEAAIEIRRRFLPQRLDRGEPATSAEALGPLTMLVEQNIAEDDVCDAGGGCSRQRPIERGVIAVPRTRFGDRLKAETV